MTRKVSVLNFEKVLELYSILRPYLINNKEKNSVLFIKGILDRMKPQEYFDCVCLLTGTKKDEVIKEDSISSITAFTTGLFENKIVDFGEIAERIGLI